MDLIIEYLKEKGFNCNDYTNNFTSKIKFDIFLNFINENYKDYNDMIYVFDLSKSIPDIGNYYKDNFKLDVSNHYLVVLTNEFWIINKDTLFTNESLDKLFCLESIPKE